MWKVLCLCLVSVIAVEGASERNISEFGIKTILKYASKIDISETCQRHMKEYFLGITSEPKEWALRMADSITKFPDGVFIGHFQIPGHFDECISAVHHNNEFTGKHCMAKIRVNKQKGWGLPRFTFRKVRDVGLLFSYGICVPSTCSAEDIVNVVNSIEGVNFLKINVSEHDCSTSEFRPFRTEDWVTVSIIIGMIIIAAASTLYDYIQRYVYNNEKLSPLWSSFSVIKNLQLIFSISQSTAQLKCLHGIRFLSMSWVIIGHSYFITLFGASVNNADIPKFLKDKGFIPISNAFVSVDSFLFLSGLLVCLVFFRDIAKKGSYDVPVQFIHRYIRLTPPYALLTLVQSTVVSRIGNGPFWNRVDKVEHQCRENWWTGILYVQNYLSPTSMCLGQSWYLSADMQMYWISPLILYPILFFPMYAPFLILALVCLAALTNFTIGFVNNLQPNFSMNLGDATFTQLELEYAPFHTRMAPWLIGLGTGYIICGLQAKKIRINLPKYLALVGWLASFALLGGSLFGIARFLESSYTSLESALYLSLHRVGWALGLSWVVIACVSGHGGLINDFLSLDIFQPLAKLSYCNFLVHMMLQDYRVNSARTNSFLRHWDTIYAYCGDLIMANLISVPLVLLFEFPFIHIDRHFFQKVKIFPFPKPKPKQLKSGENGKIEKSLSEDENSNRKSLPEDIENGKVNEGYSES